MINPYESATILLLSKNPTLIEETRASLVQEENLHLIKKEVTQGNLFQTIAQVRPDLILLDFETHHQPFYLAYKIASEYPIAPVIALLSKDRIVYSNRAIQAGARVFIQYPYPEDKLLMTIQQMLAAHDFYQAYPSPQSDPGATISHRNTFIVFSPKGGAGTTTVATNLAIGLQKNLKQEVLLLDGKHMFGHVALYLNLLTGNSITDLISHADMLDPQLIKQVVLQHKSGIRVLPSPNSITEAQEIDPEQLFRVVQSLQQVYPYIVIDGGSTLNENTVTYMDSSDKILLLLNPDIASIRDARQFIEISETLSYPKEKTLFILNRSGRKADIQKDEIENILKMELLGMIPADDDLALSSLNEGVPIILKKPRHPISKAFNEINKDLRKFSRIVKVE